MECDVCVVGAGPAGLATSIFLARDGLDTILVEKSSEIGYPVKSSAYTFKEVVDSWELPDCVMKQWCDSFFLHSAHTNREVEVNFGRDIGGYLDYHLFLRELCFKSIDEGTSILLSQTVKGPMMEKGIVNGIEIHGGKKIKSDIVIDCSGPVAVIGNKLDLLPKKSDIEIGIGIEHEFYNINVRNTKSIDFYVGQKEIVPIGYGWVFPLSKKIARVGVSSVYNTAELIKEKNINYWHEKFLGEDSPIFKRVKNAQPYETHKGTYPLSGMLEKPYSNGLILAGDSAAQASMLVGEGIRYAMEFGKRAAETSIEAIRKNDTTEEFLSKYVDKCSEYLGEFYDVAIDLLQVPTDEYWENLLDAMLKYKDKEPELILKYLKTEMTYEDAKKIFPKFVGKYILK